MNEDRVTTPPRAEPPGQAKKRTPAQILTRLKKLERQRSDGNVKSRKVQKALDRAIDILEQTIVNLSDKAVRDWLDGGDDFRFD
ncbi:hypothetical protein LCGC14_0660420 [marine sediment metagenome]|uniref:Uncharacterized protein n=1 Tax=marine sediment metagenome TaxID=412755 RepID=A0A0F9QYT8_9ZZZZ